MTVAHHPAPTVWQLLFPEYGPPWVNVPLMDWGEPVELLDLLNDVSAAVKWLEDNTLSLAAKELRDFGSRLMRIADKVESPT